MPYSGWHAARLHDPDKYDKIRRKKSEGGEGVDFLYGVKDGSTEIQSIHFDADVFSAKEAREWLDEHDYDPIEFEPATSESTAMEVEITAADGGVRVQGVAYNGGKMDIYGWDYPLAIDLKGLQIPTNVPLLADHRNETTTRIGVVKATVSGSALKISGNILSGNDQAKDIASQLQAGGHWQLSVGVDVNAKTLVRSSDSATVNGQNLEGPFYHITAGVLREVSVVAVGSDMDTELKVAATFNVQSRTRTQGNLFNNTRRPEMDEDLREYIEAKGFTPDELDEDQVAVLKAAFEAQADGDDEDPEDDEEPSQTAGDGDDKIQAIEDLRANMRSEAGKELKRIQAIKKVAEDNPDICTKAIEKGWSAEKAELEVLRASRGSSINTGHQGGVAAPTKPKVLASALCLGNKIPEDTIVDEYGEENYAKAKSEFGGPIGARRFILECAWANGFDQRGIHSGNLRTALQAAFSTQQASNILSNVANKVLLQAFNAVEDTWRAVADISPVNDFKQIERHRLTGDMKFEKIGPGGELKHGTTEEEKFTNQAETYGKIFVLTREDIINDDLGAFDNLRSRMGRGAALKLNEVFWSEWTDNTASFWDASNNNYQNGSSAALQESAITSAEQLFYEQVDADGNPMGIMPEILLVPPALNYTAAKLMRSAEYKGDTDAPSSNPHAGKFDVAMSAYLAGSNYGDDKGWWLVGSPADVPTIEVVFLNGNETPTIESADADFNVLGVQARGYYDFGVSKQDHRASVYSVDDS